MCWHRVSISCWPRGSDPTVGWEWGHGSTTGRSSAVLGVLLSSPPAPPCWHVAALELCWEPVGLHGAAALLCHGGSGAPRALTVGL